VRQDFCFIICLIKNILGTTKFGGTKICGGIAPACPSYCGPDKTHVFYEFADLRAIKIDRFLFFDGQSKKFSANAVEATPRVAGKDFTNCFIKTSLICNGVMNLSLATKGKHH